MPNNVFMLWYLIEINKEATLPIFPLLQTTHYLFI